MATKPTSETAYRSRVANGSFAFELELVPNIGADSALAAEFEEPALLSLPSCDVIIMLLLSELSIPQSKYFVSYA